MHTWKKIIKISAFIGFLVWGAQLLYAAGGSEIQSVACRTLEPDFMCRHRACNAAKVEIAAWCARQNYSSHKNLGAESWMPYKDYAACKVAFICTELAEH